MSGVERASAQQETPIFFDAGGVGLFGIVTTPSSHPSGMLAIVLPAGGTISTDRDRVAVRLCRHLADLGFPSLRFDYHGVGESDGDAPRFRLDEPFEADLLGAIAWARSAGFESVVPIGSCFGARTALACASEIPELAGVVLLAAPVRDYEMGDRVATSLAAGRNLSHHARKAFDLRVLRRLHDPAKRRAYARLAAATLCGLTTRAAHRVRPGEPASPVVTVSPGFLAPLTDLARRSIPTLLVYGTDDALGDEFRHARSGSLGPLLTGAPSVEHVTLEGAVHGFKDLAVQDAVIDLVGGWLRRVPSNVAIPSG